MPIFRFKVGSEKCENLPYERKLFLGPRNQYHSVALDAFAFTEPEDPFYLSFTIQKLSSKSETRISALPITHFKESTLTSEDLNGEFAAILPCHRSLDCL